ncbi:MAG: hypothetical protein JXA54_08535 [Candidatus Heimdallarchaeota archaeon]|nr:hypothetical protein [Candidatus Heimdallarchaeota archaeon]
MVLRTIILRTKIDVSKFKDPETSLLEEQWKKCHKLSVIEITILSCIPLYWMFLVPILIRYRKKRVLIITQKK